MKPSFRLRFSFVWACLCTVALCCDVMASPQAERTITLSADQRPLKDVLASIGARFGVSIVSRRDLATRVSVDLRSLGLDDALRAALAPAGATFERQGKIVIVAMPGDARASVPAANAQRPVAIALSTIPVDRAAAIVHRLFPAARVEADAAARSLIVDAAPADGDAIRSLLQSVDVPDATRPAAEAVVLAYADPKSVIAHLRALYPRATLSLGPNRSLLVEADQNDRTQIKALIAAIDVAPPARTAEPVTSDAVRVTEVGAAAAARAIGTQFRTVRVAAVGDDVVLTGPPDDVARAKALIAQIDVPGAGAQYTSLYRVRFVDPKAVQALLARSFPGLHATVDPDLDVISVLATGAEHVRLAAALAKIDVPDTAAPAQSSGDPGAGPVASAGGAPYEVEVVTLRAAIPNAAAGSASTTTSDVAATALAALSSVAPDLRLTPVPNLPQLVVSGSPGSVKLAKDLIARLDVPQKLVILDTQILEINETVAKNLGLSFAPNTVVSTTYSETTPQPNAAGNAIPLLGLQPLSRTPLSLQFQLGLAISQGKGRVLADPRITTLSGKTASIRAGDNITVLTQAGGGTGVAVTTQLQTFNTGVSLDITPIVNANGYVTINLHPVVNNVSSISSEGIPQISTRDTQTTIGIKEDQTLVIGGLIQENAQRTTTKIPVLGDLPLIGPAFRNEQVSNSRDELIITITPHIVDPMQSGQLIPLPPPIVVPTSAPARSVLPGATFPPMPGSTPQSAAAERELPPILVYNAAPGAYGAAPPAAVPIAQPMPAPAATPAPGGTAPPGTFATSVSALGGLPFALPSSVPQASPSAFANTNVFTYGSAPSNNYAGPGDPVQIFYATLAPTVLHDGATVSVSAVTTSNVAGVTIGYGNATTPLSGAGTGKWQASYTFSAAGIPSDQQTVTLALTATRADGNSTNISIPVSVTH